MKNCDPWEKRYKEKAHDEPYDCPYLQPGGSFQAKEWKLKQSLKFSIELRKHWPEFRKARAARIFRTKEDMQRKNSRNLHRRPLKALIDLFMHRSIPHETSKEQLQRKEKLLGSYKINKSQNLHRAENSVNFCLERPQLGNGAKLAP